MPIIANKIIVLNKSGEPVEIKKPVAPKKVKVLKEHVEIKNTEEPIKTITKNENAFLKMIKKSDEKIEIESEYLRDMLNNDE